MFLSLSKFIKKLDQNVFPNNPVPVKIVLRVKDGAPAAYYTNTKDKNRKPNKEWYEVGILARRGDDFARAVHEVRHRVQRQRQEMALFTEEKLSQIKDKRIPKILAYLRAIGKVPPLEEDAMIVERLIVESPDSTSVAALWLKQEANKVF